MKLLRFVATVIALLAVLVAITWQVPSHARTSHEFKAPRAQVFAMWTDPVKVKQWWGPRDYFAPTVRSDSRPGGEFFYSMQSPGGVVSNNVGTYRELRDGELIVQDFAFADAAGKRIPGSAVSVPGKWPDSVTVRITFADTPAGTRVTIVETGIPLIMKLFATLGWEQQYDKIDALLAATPGP
jgi:uncharacterized protein YndB with AHSA1/START domain